MKDAGVLPPLAFITVWSPETRFDKGMGLILLIIDLSLLVLNEAGESQSAPMRQHLASELALIRRHLGDNVTGLSTVSSASQRLEAVKAIVSCVAKANGEHCFFQAKLYYWIVR
eukprot:Gregarina_sp_Poly_1__7513@NODE_4195_length_692_cov_946_678400_g2766_i0_p1_GENE_NODE_4195_length_692_cov_946_678400_g2766_i0NODE_4195_length_692_cov_946_678400_g2766_i0_p1_ORF_typecomplete_len114_score14_69_NODE_4195_length_692_cov_946_678400_g2766_i0245586